MKDIHLFTLKGFILGIDFSMLALGLFLMGATVLLYDFRKLFRGNINTLKDEAVRYKQDFVGDSAANTRKSPTFGTSLSLDKKGYTIITAESRLSVDSYV